MASGSGALDPKAQLQAFMQAVDDTKVVVNLATGWAFAVSYNLVAYPQVPVSLCVDMGCVRYLFNYWPGSKQ